MRRVPVISFLIYQSILCVCGCNPVTTAVKYGVHLVGKEVDDKDAQKLGRELIGLRASAADEKLGKRNDTLRDVNSDREWLVYPTKLGALAKHMYVVEVDDNRIVAISKTETEQDELDIPRKIILEGKARGKSPRECEAQLGMGPPLLTVRSEKSKVLSQIYDARLSEELGKQKYCILRFDRNHKCCSVKLVGVTASTKKSPVY
jgi:hypothetical protein